jgi:hypothetical protein
MNETARDLLAERTRDVRALLDAVESTDRRDRRRMRELASRLAAHLRLEEELLFPIARTVAGDPGGRTVCAEVLERMSRPGGDHAKLSDVMELAESRLAGAHDAHDELLHWSIDDAAVERIGDALAARFEDVVRVTASARRVSPRPARTAPAVSAAR